ncbi:MAG: Gfo/Idh/MocA family protein [bacterium]
MKKKKIRVGIIGCGGITWWYHLPELQSISEVEVVAVADIRAGRAQQTAQHFGVPRWETDYKKLLSDDAIDAVVIATYHPTHAPIAVEAIRAGKHVLIQKPMATRLEDADRVVEAAESSNVVVYARPFHHMPSFEMAQKLIREGAIGKICMARSRVAHGGPEEYYKDMLAKFGEPDEPCWFFDPELAEGGALLDMGVYAISEITALLGPVESVFALVKTIASDIAVEDNALLALEFVGGALGTVETSWTEWGRLDKTAIYGTEGTLYLTDDPQRPVAISSKAPIYGGSNGVFYPRIPQAPANLSHQHFVDCILEGKTPLATPQHQRHVVEVMMAAYRSEKIGGKVKVNSRF